MALSIINKFTSVVVNCHIFLRTMNSNDQIEDERLPETETTVSAQLAKLNERVVTLSKLAVSTEFQLMGIPINSSEYKSLNSKINGRQDEVARIKKSLEWMDSINQRPLKQERESILRAVKDVAKNAKKFNDHSNGQKYWLYYLQILTKTA